MLCNQTTNKRTLKGVIVRDRDVERQTQHTDDVRLFIGIIDIELHRVTKPYTYIDVYIDVVHERIAFQFSHF